MIKICTNKIDIQVHTYIDLAITKKSPNDWEIAAIFDNREICRQVVSLQVEVQMEAVVSGFPL